MFLDKFQIILNFLYVCQSVSWLTSLLKLYKYLDISISGWNIFLKFFGDIPGMFVHYFWIIQNFLYVCQSVSWLTCLLISDKYRISPVPDEISFWILLDIFLRCFYKYLLFWMKYLSEIFWRHSWYVCTVILNAYKFLVCLLVC